MAFQITIPRLGWSMEEGIFAGWQKKDGDTIRRGDILFELEGEKSLQEIEAVDQGILRISNDEPKPGTILKVGAVVGYLVTEGESFSQAADSANSSTPVETIEDDTAEMVSDRPAASPSIRRMARQLTVNLQTVVGSGAGGRITECDITAAATSSPKFVAATTSEASAQAVTPRARRAAGELGVDLKRLSGSGRDGRIRERDVLTAASFPAKTSPQSDRRIMISGRRKIIADRLSESARQTVPVTITTRADATNLVSLRDQFKSSGQSPLPTFNDIVAKLVAGVLVQFPLLAGRWDGDSIVLPDPDQIHLGLAVDTPEGLIVPVLRNVATQSLISLAAESVKVIARARNGRLSSSEIQGAVFTLTNLGGFGIDAFTPVINLPETAILGLGAIRKEPVVADDGTIQIRQLMTLSLTFDHRVIDGAPAARFLQALVSSIENAAAKLISLSP